MFKSIVKEHSSVKARWDYGLQVVLGSLYIAFLSQVQVPLHPVPMTLQTFAIFTLALYLGKNKAALSTFAYLVLGTMGLPVFPHLYSNPFWMSLPSAGYLASFPLAAYAIGYLADMSWRPALLRITLSVVAGTFIIFLFGIGWLTRFMSFSEALAVGLYPFIPLAILKICGAVSLRSVIMDE